MEVNAVDNNDRRQLDIKMQLVTHQNAGARPGPAVPPGHAPAGHALELVVALAHPPLPRHLALAGAGVVPRHAQGVAQHPPLALTRS